MNMRNDNKVTIVYTGNSRKEFPFLPGLLFTPSPGIYYTAEYLINKGFNVSVIDQVIDNLTTDEIKSLIKKSNSKIFLLNQFFNSRAKVKDIASVIPKNCIVGIGGHDATFHSNFLAYGDKPLSRNNPRGSFIIHANNQIRKEFHRYYEHLDFVWQGESETGLAEFLSSFSKKNKTVLVNNLSNRTIDLDSLPVLRHDIYNGDIGFIVTSRGCLKKGCDFCTTPQFYPEGWLARSLKHVEEELHNLKTNKKKFIYILDDNFFGLTKDSLKRGIEIIKICKQLKLKCMIMSSVDQIIRADSHGILNELTGVVVKILLGVENLDVDCIRKLGKGFNKSNYKNKSLMAVDTLLRHGIYPFLGYINFRPESTLSEIKNSAKLLYENNLLATCFNNLYCKLNVFEGTPLFDRYLQHKLISIDNESGEINYNFRDINVNQLWTLLDVISYKYRILDYLENEAMKLIYMNQIQDTTVANKCYNLRRNINEFNYNTFITCINKIEKGDSVNIFIEISSIFVNQLTEFIITYKALFPELINNSNFILNEPLTSLKMI